MMSTTRSNTQTAVSLHFIVVGGGLGGLAAAIALSRVGHRATVLERYAEDASLPSGGVQLPPHAYKILARWGLADALAPHSVSSRTLRFYAGGDGALLGKHEWTEEILHECGGDYLFVQHADLRALLLSAARANGVSIRFSSNVTSVGSAEACVTLSSGEVVEGDVVVAANGAESIIRSALCEGEEEVIRTPNLVLFSTLVSVADMRQNLDLQAFIADGTVSTHFGDGFAAVIYPMEEKCSFKVFTPPPPDIDIPSSWNAPPVPVATLEAALSAAEPRLRALAALAAPPSLIALSRHAPPAEWLHPTATATVLGDGAHPPCAYFEASAMALEDAAVLGALFGRLRRREQVSHLLHAYVGLRAPRTRARLADEARNTMIMTAPSAGPIAAARDGRMRALTAAGKDVLLSGATHDEVRGQWETFCAAWTYEAEDAADDWWAKWGALEERAHDQVPEIVGKLGEVVIVVETEVVPL